MQTNAKASSSMSAKMFRFVLLGLFIILLGSIAFGFFFASNLLSAYANDTRKLNTQAAISDRNLSALKNIKEYLATHTNERDRASSIVASTKQYVYQDQIISDISAFANSSGVAVTAINFSGSGTAGGASATASAPSAATGAGVGGLKSTTAAITINSPVAYSSLLNFILHIEQNSTKMQIASVSLSKGTSADQVTTQGFQIEVYIR